MIPVQSTHTPHSAVMVLLGGGQLSRFLAESALKLEGSERIHRLIVLAESSESSVVRAFENRPGLPVNFEYGDPRSKVSLEAVREIATRGGYRGAPPIQVIFENEWVNVRDLEELFPESDFNFSPNREALKLLQRKDHQKELCENLGLPTSEFSIWDSESESAEVWVAGAFERFGRGVVLKWGSEGYDGKGTLILGERNSLSIESALQFCESARLRLIPVFAEARIQFKCELSLVGVRDRMGNTDNYPLVISEQVGGICQDTYGPATLFGIPPEIERRAVEAWNAVARNLNYVGTLAIEFFYVPNTDNPLLINEIAPRVHNTGHHTLESFGVSQFDVHVRAALGYDIPPLRFEVRSEAYGMRNVIGHSGEKNLGVLRSHPNYHDYEKSPALPGRKMGHVTFLASSAEELTLKMKEFAWLKVRP
jgi:5-(carboxyamino)imidazole ribonucleotide synthase